MSTIQNVVQIKRGPGKPADGILYPYELGYDTSEGYLYIGNEAEQAVAQKIKVGYADQAGNAESTAKLSTTTAVQVKLDSISSASFDGSENITINPGVTGILSVANGGTGLSNLTSGSYLIGNNTSPISLKTPAQVLADIGALSTTGGEVNGIITVKNPSASSANGLYVQKTVDNKLEELGLLITSSGIPTINYFEDDVRKNRMVLYADKTAFEQPVTIASGGTGAKTAADARINLGVGTNKVYNKLTDIGITTFPTTMQIVANSMPNNSTLMLDSRDIISGGTNEISDLGGKWAGIYMFMRGNSNARLSLLHIYGATSAATSYLRYGCYAATNNTVIWNRVEYRELLWENASPNSAFAAQNLTRDLSSYNAIDVEFGYSTDYPNDSQIIRAEIGHASAPNFITYSNTGDYYLLLITRSFGAYGNTIVFNGGLYKYFNAKSFTNSNVHAIPTKIYGIRF